MIALIEELRKQGDSIGGIATLVATGVPAGWGEPVFDKLKAELGKAMFSLPVHKKARHCMQHVAWLLDEMGLTPDDLAEKGDTLLGTGFFRSSREVTTLPGRSLGPGGTNAYEPVYELLFDVDVPPRT